MFSLAEFEYLFLLYELYLFFGLKKDKLTTVSWAKVVLPKTNRTSSLYKHK